MHKVPILVFLSLKLILTTGFDLSAQTIFVDQSATGANNGSSWSDALTGLQQAISIAQAGDEVWLAEGHYYPTTCTTCSEADRNISFELPDGVAFYGGFEGTEMLREQRDWQNNLTYLDGDINDDHASFLNSYTIVYTEGVSAATIVDGLHLVNGNADDINSLGSLKASGAAWFNQSPSSTEPSSPTIRNCTFKDNKANGFGAGFCNSADFSGKASPYFEQVRFISNQAKEGAGLFNDGSHQGQCTPTIRNCLFENNDATQFGGGMSNDGGYTGMCNPTVIDCFFKNNTCDSGGGAISNRAYQNGISNPYIMGTIFEGNHSGAIGGAILNFGIEGTASPTLERCEFSHNFASTYGGSIYNHGKTGNSSPKISNCLFYKNEAYSCAGMYNLGSNNGNASPEVTNCTFYANIAKYGTCIYNNAGSSSDGVSSPIITNCIFWGNIATQIEDAHIFRNVSGTPTISHSLVDASSCEALNSGTGTNTVTCTGGMIFNQAPHFVDTLNADFRLLANSPAIDAGDNTMMIEDFDLDDHLRIFNGLVDLGAFEYGSMPYEVPSFTMQPSSVTACENGNTTFAVTVAGTSPVQYQWFKNNIIIAGANQMSLSLNGLVATDEAAYSCRVISVLADTITSTAATLTVVPNVVVSIMIHASATEICAGEIVNFTATTTNGGTNPSFIWEVNNIDQNVDSLSFSSATLSDGDEVRCRLSSSETCTTNAIVTSDAQVMTVNPVLTADLTIVTSTTEICAGEVLSFSATTTNGGTNPTYEWRLNSVLVGTNSDTLTLSNLSDGDELTCQLTSSEPCVVNPTVASDPLIISVNPILVASVAITATATEICAGETVLFTATTMNAGTNPTYEWRLNGMVIGTNSDTLSLSNLSNDDEVTCQLTSSETCIANTTFISNSIVIIVNPILITSISITATATEICAGEMVLFTATTMNAGTNPVYEWRLNGMMIGTNSDTLSLSNLSNDDEVTCQLTSSETCIANTTFISNS
ncbi:MAG: immunoglobulin domain-containing protein, partial [Saprospiraceae bacterium]